MPDGAAALSNEPFVDSNGARPWARRSSPSPATRGCPGNSPNADQPEGGQVRQARQPVEMADEQQLIDEIVLEQKTTPRTRRSDPASGPRRANSAQSRPTLLVVCQMVRADAAPDCSRGRRVASPFKT